MPIGGTEVVLAAARRTARAAVIAAYRALDRVLTAAEQTQLRLDLDEADAKAILDHIVANASVVVASVSGVTTGGGVSGPGTGTIT
jgi:hypothetical protein